MQDFTSATALNLVLVAHCVALARMRPIWTETSSLVNRHGRIAATRNDAIGSSARAGSAPRDLDTAPGHGA